jgi:hypothetical protein
MEIVARPEFGACPRICNAANSPQTICQLVIQSEEIEMKTVRQYKAAFLLGVLVMTLATTTSTFAAQAERSGAFAGPKANTGYVTLTKQDGKLILTLSDDFVVPDTPDPHWRVVDSKGVIYDLQKLKIKNDGYNKSITLPTYVKSVAKVVIWCAFAEVNLGEASFKSPVS